MVRHLINHRNNINWMLHRFDRLNNINRNDQLQPHRERYRVKESHRQHHRRTSLTNRHQLL